MIATLAAALLLQTTSLAPIPPAPSTYSAEQTRIHDRYTVIERVFHCGAAGREIDASGVEEYIRATATQANTDLVDAATYRVLSEEAGRRYLAYTKSQYEGRDEGTVDALFVEGCTTLAAEHPGLLKR